MAKELLQGNALLLPLPFHHLDPDFVALQQHHMAYSSTTKDVYSDLPNPASLYQVDPPSLMDFSGPPHACGLSFLGEPSP